MFKNETQNYTATQVLMANHYILPNSTLNVDETQHFITVLHILVSHAHDRWV